MRRLARPATALLLLLAVALPVAAAGLAVDALPPAPSRWVTDEAGFLSPATRQALDQKLEAYERQTGHQVLVYVGRTTGGVPVEDWAVRAFAAWKVGRAKLDDGLALFIFPEDRKLRIEVGYGLEAQVPDAVASRIIRDVLTPGFRSGQNDAAVTQAVDALLSAIEGKPLPIGSTPAASHGQVKVPATVQLVFYGVLALGFLLLLVTNPRLALNLLFIFSASGSRRSGGGGFGGGGGGGFGGGGGRSGGGGASGSW